MCDPADSGTVLTQGASQAFAVGDVTVFSQDLVYTGDTPVSVSAVRPSCTCLRVLDYPSDVALGCGSRFWLALRPDRAGPFAYWVAVHTGNGEVLRLDIAGTVSGTAAPESVASVRPTVPGSAAGSVDGASLWDLPPSFLSHARRVPDPSLFIAASDVSAALADANSVVVDVRGRAAYVQCRIPESLNLPVHGLSTRPFLRGRDVILLDEGWCGQELIASAEKLRASGALTARIVWGGMAELARCGYRFEGQSGALKESRNVPPAAVYEGLRAGLWQAVDVSGEEDVVADILFPARVRLSVAADRDAIVQALERAAERCEPGRSILLVNRDGDCPESTGALGACPEVPVFRLVGGWNALARYLIEQGAYAGRRTVRSVGKGGCAGCP